MWTDIKAKRISGTTTVEVTLSLNNINPECNYVTHELIKISNGVKNDYAVVLHIKNDEGIELSHGPLSFSKTISVDIPKNVDCKTQELRVFYWNDKGDTLGAVLDCFKEVFEKIKLDERIMNVGPFIVGNDCSIKPSSFTKKIEYKTIPRQGGNGGVVGIADNCS